MKLADPNRQLWLWLLQKGGAWTAHDIAQQLGLQASDVFWQLSGMARRGLLEKLAPEAGSRRLRYAVTGTCQVPAGLCVAEVQASDEATQAANDSYAASRTGRALRLITNGELRA
jgi:hypothetical protein